MATAAQRVDLVNDTRGAVMMTGLFLSFFLVGALWFVMGIGDTIVFRDRMQEAADHAAFTSAALHAKGMNFISACNLIMLALVVIHLVLGLIHDITLIVCIVTGVGCVAWGTERQLYTGFAKLAKPILTGIHQLERAVAYGYPYLGLVKSIKVGEKYGKQHRVGDVDVFAVSPSMVPDFVSGTTRVGLPVSPSPMRELCLKAGDWVFREVLIEKGYNPDDGKGFLDAVAEGAVKAYRWVTRQEGGGDTEEELKKLAQLLNGKMANRYCQPLTGDKKKDDETTKKFRETAEDGNKKINEKNKQDKEKHEKSKDENKGAFNPIAGVPIDLTAIDPGFDAFWNTNGPLLVDGKAKNGNFYMQVWALNFMPKMRDPNEGKVKIAARQYDGKGGEGAPLAYFSQAEFYFDCKETWSSGDCNGVDHDHNASYSLKWRARLKRVGLPEFGELLGGYLAQLVKSQDGYKLVRKIITEDNVVYDKLSRGPLTEAMVGKLKEQVEKKVSGAEADAETWLKTTLQDAHDSATQGIYH